MKKILITMVLIWCAVVVRQVSVQAAPDQFLGDSAIYGGAPSTLEPNVLIIIDNSGSMGDLITSAGTTYVKTTAYASNYICISSGGLDGQQCVTDSVYDMNYTYKTALASSVAQTCIYSITSLNSTTTYPRSNLQNFGNYSTYPLNSDGSCCVISKVVGTRTFTNYPCQPTRSYYYTGNYINWLYDASSVPQRKIDIANTVVGDLIQTSTGIRFGVMSFHYSGSGMPTGGGAQSCQSGLSSVATVTGGFGYKVGDIVSVLSNTWDSTVAASGGCLQTSANYGQVMITSITGTGSASGLKIVSQGALYTKTAGQQAHTTYGGSGMGLVINVTGNSSNLGGSSNAQGAQFIMSVPSGTMPAYVTTVKDMDEIFSGTVTNRQALADTVQTIIPMGYTPLAESLLEAGRYYQGLSSAFSNTIGITSSGTYSSPITKSCQNNYVVLVTDGMATADDDAALNICSTNTTTARPGTNTPDCNKDSKESTGSYSDALDDVAYYLYMNDLRSDLENKQNINTYTIGFTTGSDATAQSLLQRTATLGNGKNYTADSVQTLAKAFKNAITDIMSVSSSFVAPVVPVSPENRTYSGSRVYMGFFKPVGGALWYGNLKKYGLEAITNNLVDANGNKATYMDNDGNLVDDRDGAAMPSGAMNGSFRATSISYWSTAVDKGDVQAGGVGEKLMTRPYTISSINSGISGSARQIYTFTGTNTSLTHADNRFLGPSVNSRITATLLGLPGTVISSTTVTQLVNYIHGFDVYSSNTTTKRPWIMGDILHSRPFVVNYATYDPDVVGAEANCSTNQSIIYLGSNDGMVHAFRDCDGQELWAFIPPDVLPNLQYMQSQDHAYFVDSTIMSYRYDKNGNGTIDTADGDKVVLIVGLRRGGGTVDSPTNGMYYTLDVSNPVSPTFMWSFSNDTIRNGTTKTSSTNFADLGESWSEPKIVRVKLSAGDKIVAFIGGGYDNCHEDGRYGSTQTFSSGCINDTQSQDGGLDNDGEPLTSSGAVASTSLNAASYKGRSVYAVEIASLASGVPTVATSVNKIWGYTQASTTALEFSMISEMTALDTNNDGYADRLYMGDAGGNIWRFDISNANTASWTATKIFSSNPGYTEGTAEGSYQNGRKIFYKPSAFKDVNGVIRLFFGTGDREHPLNRAVTDRIYQVIDKGQSTAVTEAKLLDVTTDLAQAGNATQVATVKSTILQAEDATNTSYYGWYIRLDSGDWENSSGVVTPVSFPGEKVLAPVTLDNNVVYITTYAPDFTKSSDPCQLGNLGVTRLYAVDYRYGSAALNFDARNDSQYDTYKSNNLATSGSADAGVRLRSDRHLILGSGIPSGIVVTGDKALIGCGGGICSSSTAKGGQVLPVYWKQQ